MSHFKAGNVKRPGGNRHSMDFYSAFRSSASAPGEAEFRDANRSPYAGPVGAAAMAAELAADPEFQQWVAEERAAEFAVLTARAHR